MGDLRTRIRQAGLRATPARLHTLERIEGGGRPITHAELAATESLSPSDPATLYRTLASLEAAGLVHRILGTDGTWRYCPQPKTPGCPGNHAHLSCEACGQMICLPTQPIPRIHPPEGWQIQSRSLLSVGRCPDCAEGPSAP